MAEARTVVKKTKNAILYSDGCIKLNRVRFSYPNFGEPNEQENEDGTKKKTFGVTAMLPKATHLDAKNMVKAALEKMMAENKNVKVPKANWCLKDGTALADEEDKKEVYRDHWIVITAQQRRPEVRDKRAKLLNGEKTNEEIDDMFYGGVWGNLILKPWYFNGISKKSKKTFPKRLLANCIGVQFVEDDDPFGQGRIDTDGMFEPEDDDDDSDAMDDDDDEI